MNVFIKEEYIRKTGLTDYEKEKIQEALNDNKWHTLKETKEFIDHLTEKSNEVRRINA